MNKFSALVLAAILAFSGCVSINYGIVKRCTHYSTWQGRVDTDFQAKVEEDLKWAVKDGCTLDVELNSPGGGVIEGLEILRQMEKAKAAGIIIKIRGRQVVASMASIILSYGSAGYREIAPGTLYLFHGVQAGGECLDTTMLQKIKDAQIAKESKDAMIFILTQMERASGKYITVKMLCENNQAGGPELAVSMNAADRING